MGYISSLMNLCKMKLLWNESRNRLETGLTKKQEEIKNQQRDMGLCFPKIPLAFILTPLRLLFTLNVMSWIVLLLPWKNRYFYFSKCPGRFVMLLNIYMGAPQQSTSAHTMVSASPCVRWWRLRSSSAALDPQPTSFHHPKWVHSRSNGPVHSDGCQTLGPVSIKGVLMVHLDGP